MKNAVGYIRVSTEEQAGNDRYGIEAQRNAIEQYAAENDYQIVKWYTDQMSGTSDDRPAWNCILSEECVSNPPFQAVIAFKSDRIARDMKLYFYYLYVLEKRNVTMLSTQEDFGEGNPFSNIYRSLMLFVAEQERKNIAIRTSAGRKIKAMQGGYSGGRPPYGYMAVNGELAIEPSEAEVVKIVFKLHDDGIPSREIAIALDEMGYKTRKNKEFQFSTICSILRHKDTYLGKYSYGDDMTAIPGKHPAILEVEENQNDNQGEDK